MSAFNVGKKVSAAIRILQRNRDASARATHLKAENWKFQSSTIERKIMSTKTSIKRIALVAAAALALGGFSAVSASANSATFTVSKNSGTKVTSPAANIVATVGSTTVTASNAVFASTDVGKSIWTDKAGLIGTIASVTSSTAVELAAGTPVALAEDAAGARNRWHLGTKAATTVSDGLSTTTINGMTVTAGTTDALLLVLDAAHGVTTPLTRMLINGTVVGTSDTAVATDTHSWLSFAAPVVAGTYAATVQFSVAGTWLETTTAIISKSFTLTVSAATTLSPALSTAFMSAPGVNVDSATATTNAIARSGAKTLGTPIAQVQINLLNADGTAVSNGVHTVSASVSGAGFVVADNSNAFAAGAATARVSSNASANATTFVHIGADGTAGTGTVTITVTDGVSAVTTTLGTFTVTSYGSATKLAIVDSNYSIGKAGVATGAAVAARTAAGEILGPLDTAATVPAFTVKATDSSSNLVNLTASGALTVPTIVSSDTTVITGGTCARDDGSSTTYSTGAGVGYYNCNFTTFANAASGSKATLTVRTVDPADSTAYLTTTYAVTVGGKVATTTLTTDASSYTPGQAMLVTLTAKDSKGNPVYDGAASPSITTNKALGGAAGFNGWYVGGVDTSAASIAKSKYYAPVIAGDFLLTATDSTLAIITTTATVTDDAASGSASLALDAANAATDAANNAYDEAQNATQAASDALAAVTALSAQVSALIATVKSLAAMVAKIKAKVKA